MPESFGWCVSITSFLFASAYAMSIAVFMPMYPFICLPSFMASVRIMR